MPRRASINLISNTIELPGLEDLPIEMLVNREFPIATMLSFIHEVTHHWCFNSPVGLTQTLLYRDAITMMFSYRKERSDPAGGARYFYPMSDPG
jgi:hypothetical protein